MISVTRKTLGFTSVAKDLFHLLRIEDLFLLENQIFQSDVLAISAPNKGVDLSLLERSPFESKHFALLKNFCQGD